MRIYQDNPRDILQDQKLLVLFRDIVEITLYLSLKSCEKEKKLMKNGYIKIAYSTLICICNNFFPIKDITLIDRRVSSFDDGE